MSLFNKVMFFNSDTNVCLEKKNENYLKCVAREEKNNINSINVLLLVKDNRITLFVDTIVY